MSYIKCLLSLLFSFVCFKQTTFSYEFAPYEKCGYMEEGSRNESAVDQVHFESSHKLGRSIKKGNLRFKLFYDKTVEGLPDKTKQVILKVVPIGTKFWSDALVVPQLSEPIRLNRGCVGWKGIIPAKPFPLPCCKDGCLKKTICGDMIVPEEHLGPCRICYATKQTRQRLGPGVNGADLVLYVSANASTKGCKAGVIAHAIHCAREDKLDRPIAGGINICPKPSYDIDSLVSTVEHEILHILGFSRYHFGFFRNKKGEPLVKRSPFGIPIDIPGEPSPVYRKLKRNWKYRGGKYALKETLLLTTPKVVQEVRDHFKCPHLEGAELEDQGTEFTKGSHWEKRVFEEEGMSGVATYPSKFTRLTFALLEDSGWYEPNYRFAVNSSWGSSLGCDFAKKSCKQWMDIQKAKDEDAWPFCDTLSQDLKCTYDRSSIGICQIVKHKQKIPDMFQHFDHLPDVNDVDLVFYGGGMPVTDYCPYVREIVYNDRITRCGITGNEPKNNNFLEDYGEGSKCFEYGPEKWANMKLHSDGYETMAFGETAGCYKYSCTNGRIHVKVLTKEYPCFYRKQEVQIKIRIDPVHFISGSIICPACSELCSNCTKDDKEAAAKYDYRHEDINAVLKGYNYYRSFKPVNKITYIPSAHLQSVDNKTTTNKTTDHIRGQVEGKNLKEKLKRRKGSKLKSKLKGTLHKIIGRIFRRKVEKH